MYTHAHFCTLQGSIHSQERGGTSWSHSWSTCKQMRLSCCPGASIQETPPPTQQTSTNFHLCMRRKDAPKHTKGSGQAKPPLACQQSWWSLCKGKGLVEDGLTTFHTQVKKYLIHIYIYITLLIHYLLHLKTNCSTNWYQWYQWAYNTRHLPFFRLFFSPPKTTNKRQMLKTFFRTLLLVTIMLKSCRQSGIPASTAQLMKHLIRTLAIHVLIQESSKYIHCWGWTGLCSS